MFFRNTHAFHRRQLNLGNNHSAQQTGIVFADSPLGNIHQENFAFVHDVKNIDGADGLTDDIADDGSGKKLPDFILNRRDGFIAEFILPSFVFVHPKSFNDRVFQIGNYFLAIIFIHQHSRNAEQASSPEYRAAPKCNCLKYIPFARSKHSPKFS